MKYLSYHDEQLTFLTFSECLEAGISEDAIKKAKQRGSNSWLIIDDPTDARRLLICYNKLSEFNKQKVLARFGNPSDHILLQPIRAMITATNQAKVFFLGYRYGDKTLPLHRVKQYSRACDILELIKRIDESRNKLIKDLGISVPEFYNHLKSIIQEDQANGESETYEGTNQLYARFPSSYVKLREKVDEYKKAGYPCVIEKNIGNNNNLKVRTDDAKDRLIELLKDPVQHNDVAICMFYNCDAVKNGWKIISPGTVQNWRKEYAAEIAPYRYGQAEFNDKFIPVIPRFRPTHPGYMAEHDDYNHNFLYQDANGEQYHRYVSIIVTDSYCDYVLGKSTILGSTPQTWQVLHAYIDAMYHIRKLTNSDTWYMPWEFKADRWRASYNQKTKDGKYRNGTLDPFYNKLTQVSKVVPPARGNKRRGFIEQFFGSPFLKTCEKLVSDKNYNGNNMTAVHRGFNPDMLKQSLDEKSRPLIGNQAELQVEQFFYLLRKMSDFKRIEMDAPSKEQKWLKAWNELTPEQKNPITDEQFLLTFGVTHQPKHSDTIRITNKGITPQIDNVKHSFKLPELWMYQKLNGEPVQVIYDPYDMNRVLITNNDDIRFIAKSAEPVPSALKDHHVGSRTYLNALLAEKTDMVNTIAATTEKRKKLGGVNAEAMLQSGAVLPKEISNAVQQKVIEKFNEEHENYLDQNNDFNAYL